MELPKISFKYELMDGDDHDMFLRGYRNDVIVSLPNGKSYELSFYDPSRIAQEVEQVGYLGEKNLIVIREVNVAFITEAVHKLWKESFFDDLG